MNDLLHTPEPARSIIQEFGPNSVSAGSAWHVANRPRGASMLSLFLLAGGGNGGVGIAGANSAAGGGGGGGSSSQTMVTIPAYLLPESLYLSIGYSGIASRISINPDTTANHCLAIANAGGTGGGGTTGAGGAAGAAGAIATIANMPLAGAGQFTLLAGQAGIAGGFSVAGVALTLPTTGLYVTGGTGGGGLPATATNGRNGGSFTLAGTFPANAGGLGSTVTTTPGGDGNPGFDRVIRGLLYSYGGTGGGSTNGSATGAGLASGKGGNGGRGCGGGGSGAGLTGSTIGAAGLGGPGYALLMWW